MQYPTLLLAYPSRLVVCKTWFYLLWYPEEYVIVVFHGEQIQNYA